jgi:hypothetical protein
MVFECKQCGKPIGSVAKIIDLNILHAGCVEEYNSEAEVLKRQMKELREATTVKWEKLGFFEPRSRQLYESQASHIIEE